MHQWQKFGENLSTDTGDIAETKLPRESRTHGRTHGRTTRKHIASAGAYRWRRLKNSVGEAHVILPRFTNLATPTVSDESEVYGGRGAPNMIVDPGRHNPSRRHCSAHPYLLTNRKSHTRFRLVPKLTTLDDLEGLLCTLFQNTCVVRSSPRTFQWR